MKQKKKSTKISKHTFQSFAYLLTIVTLISLIVTLGVMLVKDFEIEKLEASLGVNPYAHFEFKERIPVKEQMKRYIESLPMPEKEFFKQTEEEIIEIQDDEGLEPRKIEEMQNLHEFKVMEIQLAKTSQNYSPTEEEREYAYKVAFAEASTQGTMGQTLIINIAINNMRKNGFLNLIQEFEAKGRYSSVENGEVYNNGKIVELSDIPDNVKQAVEDAFQYDYTEEILKQEATNLGITDSKYWKGGATYFYNPNVCSERQNKLRKEIKVKFQYGEHIYYCYWDK